MGVPLRGLAADFGRGGAELVGEPEWERLADADPDGEDWEGLVAGSSATPQPPASAATPTATTHPMRLIALLSRGRDVFA